MRIKEPILKVCRKHWSAFVLQALLALVLIAAGFTRLIDGEKADAKSSAVIMIIGVVIAFFIWLAYRCEYIALTETSLIGHKGIFRSKTLSTPLNKVQSVGLSNGLLGKILRYHTVTVANAATGATEFVFFRMAKAQAFADAVNERLKA